MKKILFIGILYLVLFGCNADKEENPTEYTDLSFYLTGDTLARELLDINTVHPEGKPFIPYRDIVSYDSASHIYELNHPIDTLFDYTRNYDGRGFVAMLDTTKIYCGVIYSPTHSSTNPNIVITLPFDESSNDSCLQIIEGYPNEDFYAGHADINDSRIIELLKRDNKLK